MPIWLDALLEDPNTGAALMRYLITLFGTMAMYVFSLHKGFEGAGKWLRNMFPGRKKVSYQRMDFLIVVLAGSVIGTIAFAPRDNLQALTAGLSWVSLMNVLLSKGGSS
jgi:hypothetical protein